LIIEITWIFFAMANSALHAIAIEDLRISNPAFHQEYCLLVEGISNLIFRLAKKHGDYITYSTFTESYDRASKEPILQMVWVAIKMSFTFISTSPKMGVLLLVRMVWAPARKLPRKHSLL
jgi:hypothetical protein